MKFYYLHLGLQTPPSSFNHDINKGKIHTKMATYLSGLNCIGIAQICKTVETWLQNTFVCFQFDSFARGYQFHIKIIFF